MSFLSDLGSFLSDAQQVSEDFGAVKDDVVNGAKDAFMQISSQTQDVASELQANADTITQTAKDAASDVSSQLKN